MHTSSAGSVEVQLENSLKEIGIPPRPLILEHIASEMRKEVPDFNHLADLITADVGLSASLIKITNAPFFGFRSRVKSPREALMVLGLKVAGQAIAGIVMRRVFPTTPQMERFWDASARIARLSGWLSEHVIQNKLHSSDAYTFGLFRDCGIPILYSRLPGYREILIKANHEMASSFTEVEDAALPTNHAIVGSLLTQNWWLPDEITYSVRYHHDVPVLNAQSIPPSLTSRYLIAITQFAEYLMQQHTGLGSTREWPKFHSACMRLLNLDEEDVRRILAETSTIAKPDI